MTDKHEALIFADDRRTSSGDDLYEWAIDAEDWIRRLHARIAELEAQLEAIGAGGVAPLIGQQTRDSFTAADMATAAEEGYRDGAAELRRQHTRIAELQARIKTMAEEHADELMVAHLDGRMRAEQAIPGVQWQCGPQANGFTAPQADSQPAGADRHGLPPLPDPDLRDVGTTPRDIKEFLRGYATEYAKAALAARAPADSVLEDAQVEIDLFNDLNRICGNTLTAYAKEMCRLGYRKTNAARKQGETNEH